MKIDDALNDREKKEIQKFIKNEVQMEAVKKVFLYGVYQSGTLKPGEKADTNINFALNLIVDPQGNRYHINNEEAGQKLRAAVDGIMFIEDGFQQLKAFEDKPKKEKKEGNPAI